jgi:methyltransferase (TIGR00027 family)
MTGVGRLDSPLRNVSDTARWLAAYRAEESERPDALFSDPYARRLAGQRGFDVLAAMPKGRALSWPLVARTVMFDRHVAEAIADGCDLVVNLAAGLDTRPYRMDLPPELRWVEVDLPEMVEYKAASLASELPRCRLERLSADLADDAVRREVLADVATRGERALVLSEGLLIYLEPRNVEALAGDLALQATFERWVVDLVSPGLLARLAKGWGREVARADAPFRFAPVEGPAYFAAYGWDPAVVETNFAVAARIRRLPWYLRPFAWLPEPRTWKPQRVWGGVVRLDRRRR